MKEKIPTLIAIVIILLFFIGAIAIFVYQYIMLEKEKNIFDSETMYYQTKGEDTSILEENIEINNNIDLD